MAKVKLTADKIQEIVNTVNESDDDLSEIELDTDGLTFTDGYGLYPEKRVDNVGKRVNRAYDNAKKKILNGEIDDFDEYLSDLKTAHNLADADAEPETEWKQKYVSPVKSKNAKLEKENEQLRKANQSWKRTSLDSQIIEGAREAGVRDEVLSDKERFLRQWRDDFQYDDEAGEWGLLNGDGFQYSEEDGSQYAGPTDLFNNLKSDESKTYLFSEGKNQSSGFQQSETNSGTTTISQSELSRIAQNEPERYKKLRKKAHNGKLNITE